MLECILTQNRCCKLAQTITPKGVMVHSTGANNPNLKRYVQPSAASPNKAGLLKLLGTNNNANDWNRDTLSVCVHAFIGKLADGAIETVQTLPWNYRGWHAGVGSTGRSANDTHISFEICEDDLTDPTYFNQVYREAVNLTAMLCQSYKLDPMADGVVICHSEGASRGIASNHADVMHWFPKYAKTMNDFRRDVSNKMKEDANMSDATTPVVTETIQKYELITDVPDYFRPAIDKLVGKGLLEGTGGGKLNVSYDFCRTMTVLDRAGIFDN